MTVSRDQGNVWALSSVLFAAFFILGDVLLGVLAQVPLPLPDAPATDVVRFYEASRAAALAQGFVQILSAVSLFVFVAPVATFVRRIAAERRAGWADFGRGYFGGDLPPGVALLGLVPALTAGGLGQDLVGTFRQMNFLSGGTLHVASLGLFVGATSIAASRAKALLRWIAKFGIVAAALAILSLASLVLYPVSVFIPLGRLLSFVWSIAVGIKLALGKKRRDTNAGL